MEVVATAAAPALDIQYLLFLQNFRNSINDGLTPFMESISLFAVTYLIMIPVLFYWLLSKRDGLYTLLSYYLTCGINAIVKLTVCAYRPWIRDARVLPAGDAISTATGYSFPSGHTVTATPIYGGLALTNWKRAKWFSILCLLLALITGFSRNYLGVHTPQDVIVGMCESILALWAMSKLFHWLEQRPEKEDILLAACFIFGWLGIAYITFKPYPMDYVDGNLLVDPKKMMVDGYGDIALLISFPVARYIEKRWVRFEATGINTRGVIVCAVGMAILWAMLTYMKAPLGDALGKCWGHFVNNTIVVLYCITLFPLVIRLCCGKGDQDGNTASVEE